MEFKVKLTIITPILIMMLAVSGCTTTSITTKTIPVAVPILYSPVPPVVVRPTLPIDTITEVTPAGNVVKDYAASIQVLLGYSQELEYIVKQYKDISDAYAELKTKVEADWKAKTGQDLVVAPQTITIKSLTPVK